MAHRRQKVPHTPAKVPHPDAENACRKRMRYAQVAGKSGLAGRAPQGF
jgi:hypothetical protein